MTLQEKPKASTHGSGHSMAKAAGDSPSSVQRIFKAHGLNPYLPRAFKLSRDPNFSEKVADVENICLNPPGMAVVLSVDEKSQIQARDRTQPGLPMKKGRAGTLTREDT
jgi:hypothetical protein